MPSACKNWYTIGRWADVSNPDYGLTWVTLDAPLIQVGGITATLLGSQGDPKVWRKKTERTQRIYSWAMNNHWGTNYRAYQDGPVRFRFVLRPHRRFDPAEASRFAVGFSQPLIPRRARGASPKSEPLLRVEPADVLVTAVKPSDDGKALIVRLFGASGKPTNAKIMWLGVNPRTVSVSDTSERAITPVSGPIEIAGYGLVTLRAELQPTAVARIH
jgi:alpha-mannosidase